MNFSQSWVPTGINFKKYSAIYLAKMIPGKDLLIVVITIEDLEFEILVILSKKDFLFSMCSIISEAIIKSNFALNKSSIFVN